MNNRFRLLLWAGLIALAVALLFGGRHQPLGEDISSMLPGEDDPQLAAIEQQLSAQFANKVLLLLGSRDVDQTVQSARALADFFQQQGAFSEVSLNATALGQQLATQFFPYRYHLLTDEQGQWLEQHSLEKFSSRLWRKLNATTTPVSSSLLAHDPWLLFSDWLSSRSQTDWLLHDGLAVRKQDDQYWTLVTASFTGSAFAGPQQQQLLPVIAQGLAQLPQSVSVLRAGLLFHAAAATAQAKQEISLIGGLSVLGIVLLVAMVFASLRPLLLILLTVGSGILMAFAVCWWLFQPLQLLTLVFGASLIGVAVDYSFHWCCDRQQNQQSVGHSLQHLAPALFLSAATSILAYLAMLLTPLPLVRQMATFCAVGLATSVITLWLLAPCVAPCLEATRFTHYLWRILPLPGQRGLWLLLLLVAAGCWRFSINDDIRLLRGDQESLVSQENKLRQYVGEQDSQFFVIWAQSVEQALQRDEQLHQRLADFPGIKGTRGVSEWLPSLAAQQHAYQLQRQLYAPAALARLAELGFSRSMLNAARDAFLRAEQQPLTPERLPDRVLPIAGLYQFTSSSPYLLRRVQGISDLPGLTAIAESLPGVTFVDPVARISKQMAHYRQMVSWVVGAIGLMAFLVLSLRLGRTVAWRLVLVPICGVLAGIGWSSWLGQPFTLFHALALLLVFGVGIDYALFHHFAERHRSQASLATTLAALSTLFAFGALAFSSTPALAGFGNVVMAGIVFCYGLAPVICRRPDRTIEDVDERR